jgi:hypothetical protein
MRFFGLAFAFIFTGAGAATAAGLSYEPPPPEQVFTPVSAVDWTGFQFAGDLGLARGNASGSFLDALFGTSFIAPMAQFRTGGWIGGLQGGYDIPNSQTVHAVKGDVDLAGIQGAARGLAAETVARDPVKGGIQDRNGRQTLGVDVSHAGSTPARVRRFLTSLPADAASNVRTGCTTVMSHQANHHPALVRFCSALPQKSVALP